MKRFLTFILCALAVWQAHAGTKISGMIETNLVLTQAVFEVSVPIGGGNYVSRKVALGNIQRTVNSNVTFYASMTIDGVTLNARSSRNHWDNGTTFTNDDTGEFWNAADGSFFAHQADVADAQASADLANSTLLNKVDVTNGSATNLFLSYDGNKQCSITNIGTAGHQRPSLSLQSANSGGEIADLFFYSRGMQMFAIQGQSGRSNVFSLNDTSIGGVGNIWKYHDGYFEIGQSQTNSKTITINNSTAGLISLSGTSYVAGLTWPLSSTYIASNATTAQVDFSTNQVNTLEITNLNANITLQLTNLTYGREAWVYIRTDGGTRTVTVSTNGITTGTRVSWDICSVTNGSSAFTVTNRARINFTCRPVAEVAAAYTYQQ